MSKSWADSLTLGKHILKNRVFMSALTRTRCHLSGIPNQTLIKYYTQRTGAGLIFTEANSWSKRGQAFPGAGNLYTVQQAEGWKKVVDAVHDRGTKIFLQLCHAGRATDPQLNGGFQALAPSAIAIRQEKNKFTNRSFPVPKAATIEEIHFIQKEFEESIKLSLKSGFDGISLHGSFGYLIDNFLRSHTNQRTDEYGGSAANRSRFVLQLIDIVLKYYEPYQIGIKLSPTSRIQDMYDENPEQTYSYLLTELDKKNIGFVELSETKNQFNNAQQKLFPKKPEEQIKQVAKTLKPFYKGLIVGNYGYTPQSGLEQIQASVIDAVTFGRFYISNPDLAERVISGVEINKRLDFKTFYGAPGQEKGYTDYPFYESKL